MRGKLVFQIMMHRESRREAPAIAITVLLLCIVNGLCMLSANASIEDLTQGMEDVITAPRTDCSAVDAANDGWSLRLDNDVFAVAKQDRDYTGGFNVTLYDASKSRRLIAPARRALRWLDRTSGFVREDQCVAALQRTEVSEFGLILFTPDDIGQVKPSETDRPYANLLFLGSSHYTINTEQTVMRQSTMTIGLLGTPIAEAVHRGVHKLLGSQEPQGYSQQVSAGGELTARYSVARYSLLSMGSGPDAAYDLKFALEGSVGYLTEGAISVGVRWGRISSPWWSSVSDHADYDSQPSLAVVGVAARPDVYLSTGVKLRARAYNAFLQGQFKDGGATLSASSLQTTIREAWLGVIADLGNFRLSYTLRFQSPELKEGQAARDLRWASLMVSKRFR